MLRQLNIAICGGGIGGLSLAALLRRSSGVRSISVFERSGSRLSKDSLGGGIGLWPPSLQVLEQIEILKNLEEQGTYMTSPAYLDRKGNHLGKPTPQFPTRFPVLCLQRDHLRQQLLESCLRPSDTLTPVQIHFDSDIISYQLTDAGVNILTPTQVFEADLLIGADGIASPTRKQLFPHVKILPLGYAYFRANVQCQDERMWKATFEAWGNGVRFGYVPLGKPDLFWFVAVPLTVFPHEATHKNQFGIEEATKQKLLELISGWAGHPDLPLNPKDLISMTRPEDIVRTEISKIPHEPHFDWSDPSGKVILLGDAAHATAPNLAQGAGLSIEDAAELYELINKNLPLQTIAKKYESSRRVRARTVQRIADIVAYVGQTSGFIASAKDRVLYFSTLIFPWFEKRIFERVVSFSLGGSSTRLYWTPTESTPLWNALGVFNLLKLEKEFKKIRMGSRLIGTGNASVDSSSGGMLASLVARISGIPRTNKNIIFKANSDWIDEATKGQIWTRIFGEDKYSTEMSSVVSFSVPSGVALLESVFPPSWGRILSSLKIGYVVNVSEDGKKLFYKSIGMWLGGLRVPLPGFLCVQSEWFEEGLEDGWTFDGIIKLPSILGSGVIMEYRGEFHLREEKRVLTE